MGIYVSGFYTFCSVTEMWSSIVVKKTNKQTSQNTLNGRDLVLSPHGIKSVDKLKADNNKLSYAYTNSPCGQIQLTSHKIQIIFKWNHCFVNLYNHFMKPNCYLLTVVNCGLFYQCGFHHNRLMS